MKVRLCLIVVFMFIVLMATGCHRLFSASSDDQANIEIVESIPSDGEQEVNPTIILHFGFDQRLNANTVKSDSIIVYAINNNNERTSDIPVRGTVSHDRVNRLFIKFKPDVLLAVNQKYLVTIADIFDQDNRPLPYTELTFTTRSTFSSETPKIVQSTTPSDQQTGVVLSANIQFQFTLPMDPNTIGSESVVVKSRPTNSTDAYTIVNGEHQLESSSSALTFSPTNNLLPAHEYQVTLSGLIGMSGETVETLQFTFHTINIVGIANIIGHEPLSGQTKVSVNTSVQFMFDGPIDPTSVVDTSISIEREYENPAKVIKPEIVHGTVTYDESSDIVIFQPLHQLSYGGTYIVRLSGVKSLDGAVIGKASTQFTTFYNTVYREIYYQTNSESAQFGEMKYYNEYEVNSQGQIVRKYTFRKNSGLGSEGSGSDNKWLTADDLVQTVNLYNVTVNGQKIKEITYSNSNEFDRTWQYRRNNVIGYKKDLYDNGQWLGLENYNRTSSGNDDIILTSDDIVYQFSIKRLLDNNEVQEVTYKNPGPDGSWLTHEDNSGIRAYWISIYDNQHHKQILRTFLAGEDTIPLTSDDDLVSYREVVYDQFGRLEQSKLFAEPGAESRWLNEKDYLFLMRTDYIRNADEQKELIESWNLGLDEVWSTPDDRMTSYRQYTYDTQGNRTRYAIYNGAGLDGLWRTKDDIVSEEHLFHTDK